MKNNESIGSYFFVQKSKKIIPTSKNKNLIIEDRYNFLTLLYVLYTLFKLPYQQSTKKNIAFPFLVFIYYT